MSNQHFEEWLKEFAASVEDEHADQFLALWNHAGKVLDFYPNTHGWRVDPLEKPYWVKDNCSLNAWLWQEMIGRVDVLVCLHAFRIAELKQSIEEAFLSNRLLIGALSLRSLIENAANLYHYGSLILEKFNPALLAALQAGRDSVVDKDLEDALIRATHGRRFDWQNFLKGDIDSARETGDKINEEWKQKSILNFIDEATKEYETLRFVYNLLCDCVHPNFGSNILYLAHEGEFKFQGQKNPAAFMTFKQNPDRSKSFSLWAFSNSGIASCYLIIIRMFPEIERTIRPFKLLCSQIQDRYRRLSSNAPS